MAVDAGKVSVPRARVGKGGREALHFRMRLGDPILPEERQDPLLRLAGERQGLDAQLSAGLQGEQVGAFLVEVGQVSLSAPVCRVFT